MIKNFMIFGDSYSTYEGYIPTGYPFYYSKNGRFPEKERDVTKMKLDETWWRRIINSTDANLVLNNSWSGSTICYTGYSGDCSKTSSFICRYRKLLESGFFKENKIDTVLVFGGTNDSWANAPLGEFKLSDIAEEDLYCVLPAISYFAKTLREDIPCARIVFIANCDIKTEIISAMKAAGEHFGVEVVELSCIDKLDGHPTAKGMEEIAEQIIARMKTRKNA